MDSRFLFSISLSLSLALSPSLSWHNMTYCINAHTVWYTYIYIRTYTYISTYIPSTYTLTLCYIHISCIMHTYIYIYIYITLYNTSYFKMAPPSRCSSSAPPMRAASSQWPNKMPGVDDVVFFGAFWTNKNGENHGFYDLFMIFMIFYDMLLYFMEIAWAYDGEIEAAI